MTYPDLDIKNLTLDQAKAIYKRDWWDKLNADSLDAAIVFQVWDFAISREWVPQNVNYKNRLVWLKMASLVQ
jgi:lysozyme family protein